MSDRQEDLRSGHLGVQATKVAAALFGDVLPNIDRFEVVRVLGAGACAVVYQARDPLLERDVALKVLGAREPRLPGDREGPDPRFLREARTLAKLRHPNIVALYHAGEWAGRHYLAMELIAGQTLSAYLAARPSRAEILEVFRAAGRGLAFAHRSGHVHRDVKPSNVMVEVGGRVVVTDFGLVGHDALRAGAERGEPTQTSPVGTPAYVAPEQRAGAPAKAAADVYSFALMLAEALLGELPRPEHDQRWRARLRRCVGLGLATEIAHALEVDPERRAASLDRLLAALAPRPSRRLRWAGLGAAAGLTAAVAVLAPSSWTPAGEVPRDAEGLHAAVVAHLEVPRRERGAAWVARARALAMAPVPALVPCRWPRAPSSMAFVDGAVLAIDGAARLWQCSIDSGEVTEVPGGGACFFRVTWAAVGLVRPDGAVEVRPVASAEWRRLSGPGAIAPPFSVARCLAAAYLDERTFGRPEHGVRTFRKAGREISLDAAGVLSVRVRGGPAFELARDVRNASFDLAGRRVLVREQSRARLLDVESGALLAQLSFAQSGRADRFVVSEDGDSAVMQHGGSGLLWWHAHASEPTWHSPGSLSAMVYRPDGQRIVGLTSPNGEIEVRELVSRRRIFLGAGAFRGVDFCGPDCIVAYDVAGRVYRWSLRQQRASILADHDVVRGSAWGMCVTPDEAAVATSTSSKVDRVVRVARLDGRAPVEWPIPEGSAHALACRDDRVWVGTTASKIYELTSVGQLSRVVALPGAFRWLWSVVGLSGDDLLVGTGFSLDAQGLRGPAKLLWVRHGQVLELAKSPEAGNTGVVDIRVTADERYAAATTSAGGLVILDLRRGTTKQVFVEHGFETRLALLPRGGAAVTAGEDAALRVWDLASGALRRELALPADKVYVLEAVPDTDEVLVGTNTGRLQRWRLASGELLRQYRGHAAAITAVAQSRDGRRLVTADFEGKLCVRSADSDGCSLWLDGHELGRPIFRVAVLRDGRVLSLSNDGTLRLWRPSVELDAEAIAGELSDRLFPADSARLARRE